MCVVIDPRQRSVALLVAGCFFMETLDGTIVTTSAPRIGAALHVASTDIGLVMTSYLITLAAVIPLSGWLVARFGARRVFILAIVIFTGASFACAMSVDIGELVAMRVVQGVGGAMMVPVGRLTVLAKAAKADILRMVAYIVWPALVAPVIAPLAGGLITTYASWRWLFLINVPLGVLAFVAALKLMPSTPRTPAARLDWLGVLLTCSGLGGLTYTAHLLAEPTMAWGSVGAIGIPTIVLLAATARHLLRTDAPLVDLRTLRVRSLRSSLVGGSAFRVAMGAMPFLLPLLFENVFAWSPIKAGGVVLFLFVGNIGIKPATTFLLNRFGFRVTLIGATAGLAGTIAGTGLVTSATPLVLIVAVTLLGGAARSVGATAYTALGYSDIPESEMPHANGLASTVQQLAAAFGIAAATIALRVGAPISDLLSAHAAKATAYSIAFILLGLLSLVATVAAVRLHPDAGRAVRRARSEPSWV
jgi:EmrB/QacA subfamily drug resistance transporter